LDFKLGGNMKYEVKRYYSSFVTFEVEANSEEEAYNKTKELELNLIELQNNLENWDEADEINQSEENH
jgi:hypothetical protein